MRCQLNGPNAFELTAAFTPGLIVTFSHSSGKVLPWTTIRWKFGTS